MQPIALHPEGSVGSCACSPGRRPSGRRGVGDGPAATFGDEGNVTLRLDPTFMRLAADGEL